MKFRVLAGAAMFACAPLALSAATVTVDDPTPQAGFVTSVTYNDNNSAAGRGTSNNRDDATNAFGAADGQFFEIGLFDVVYFHFNPSFISPGGVIEITNGNRDGYQEFANVAVGNYADGIFTEVNESPIQNVAGTISFTFAGGPFDTIKMWTAAGTRVDNCGYECGGFDVDAISVSAVPLPASALLLLGGVGGLAALRRRRKAA